MPVDEDYILTRTGDRKYANDDRAAENCVVVIIGMRDSELPERKGDIEAFFAAVGVPRNPPLPIKLILYDDLAASGISTWETVGFGKVDVVAVQGHEDPYVALHKIMDAASELDPGVGTQADVVVSDYCSPSLWISDFSLNILVLNYLKPPSKCKLPSGGGVVFASTIPIDSKFTSGGRVFQQLEMPAFKMKFGEKYWKDDFEMQRNYQGNPLPHPVREQHFASAAAVTRDKAAGNRRAPAQWPWESLGILKRKLMRFVGIQAPFVDMSGLARSGRF